MITIDDKKYDTIDDAIDAANSGDTILLGDGTYYEAVELISKTNITLKAAPDAKPVISGAIEALTKPGNDEWTLHEIKGDRNIYKTRYQHNVYQPIALIGNQRLWTYMSEENWDKAHAGQGVWLDKSSGWLYIWLDDGKNPGDHSIRISRYNQVLYLKQAKKCRIEGITLECGGEGVIIIRDHSNDNVITKCGIAYAVRGIWFKSAGTTDSQSRNRISACHFYDSYAPNWGWEDIKQFKPKGMETGGVQFRSPGEDNIVEYCTFDNWFDGVRVGVEEYQKKTPIKNTEIRYNLFNDVRDDAFAVELWSEETHIHHNKVVNAWVGLATMPHPLGKTWVHNNLFICNRKALWSPGEYKDGRGTKIGYHLNLDCQNVRYYHNTVISNSAAFTAKDDHKNWIVRNNIFYITDGSGVAVAKPGTAANKNKFDGNLYWRTESSATALIRGWNGATSALENLKAAIGSAKGIESGWEASGIEADPKLDDDYQISEDSPAVNKAIELHSFWPGSGQKHIGHFQFKEVAYGIPDETTSPDPVDPVDPTPPEPSVEQFPIIFGLKIQINGPGEKPIIILEPTEDANIIVPSAKKLININTASSSVLQTLPRIGPVTAQLIIAGRDYRAIEDVLEIKGIGPATFDVIQNLITVDEDRSVDSSAGQESIVVDSTDLYDAPKAFVSSTKGDGKSGILLNLAELNFAIATTLDVEFTGE